MIAIDTNVLLRYLLADDAKQYSKAKKIIVHRRPVLIADVVLAETVWTLIGKRYAMDKTAICGLVRSLMGDGGFVFESSQVIWSALRDYENAKVIRGKSLDFVDALIANKAYFSASKKGTKLRGFYSFDKAVEQLDGAKLIK